MGLTAVRTLTDINVNSFLLHLKEICCLLNRFLRWEQVFITPSFWVHRNKINTNRIEILIVKQAQHNATPDAAFNMMKKFNTFAFSQIDIVSHLFKSTLLRKRSVYLKIQVCRKTLMMLKKRRLSHKIRFTSRKQTTNRRTANMYVISAFTIMQKRMSFALSQLWQQSDQLTRKKAGHDGGDHGGVVLFRNSGKNLEDESVSGHWENNAGHPHSSTQHTATSSFTSQSLYSQRQSFAQHRILKVRSCWFCGCFFFTVCSKCFDLRQILWHNKKNSMTQ